MRSKIHIVPGTRVRRAWDLLLHFFFDCSVHKIVFSRFLDGFLFWLQHLSRRNTLGSIIERP
jgi:hypothetical protein